MTEIKAKIILEVAGFPKEHVEKTMNAVINEISSRDYNVEEKEIMPIEEKEKMFSGLSELTVIFKDLDNLYGFCFDFMPASVDILEPEVLSIGATELNDGLNDLLAMLHNQDMFLKNSNARAKILNNNLGNLISNFILTLAKKEISLDELTKKTGIEQEKLKNLLDSLIKKNIIEKKGDKYIKK